MNELHIGSTCINQNDGVVTSSLCYSCDNNKHKMIFDTLTKPIKLILDRPL